MIPEDTNQFFNGFLLFIIPVKYNRSVL